MAVADDDALTAGAADATAWAVHRLGVALAAVDAGIAGRLGLSPVEFVAVKHLLMSAEPVGPGDIARLVGMSSGSATELVDRLHRAGHVRRVPDVRDGRRRVVQLTPGSKEKVREAMRAASAGITDAAARSGAGTAHAVTTLLTDISEHLHRWAQDTHPQTGDPTR